MNFLMVIMASGIARGRVRTTTTTVTTDRVAQDGGHTPSNSNDNRKVAPVSGAQ